MYPGRTVYNGPSPGPYTPPGPYTCARVLDQYPRLHLVSTNQVVLAGQCVDACKVRHNPQAPSQNWLFNAPVPTWRGY